MRRALVLIASLSAFPLTLAAQTPPRSTLVHGRVVADETGSPVRNARVSLADDAGSAATVTDEDGRFLLAAAASSQPIAVTKAGFAKATKPATEEWSFDWLDGSRRMAPGVEIRRQFARA